MTSERDFDRIARAWLDLGPNEAPDRAVAAVLQAVESTPQVRRPLRRPVWRPTTMTRFSLLAVLAGTIAIAIGALVMSGGGPAPAPTTAPASVAPQPAGGAYATPQPVPAAIRGGWTATSRGTPVEDPDLTTIVLGGSAMDRYAPEFSVDRPGKVRGMGSNAVETEPGVLRITLSNAGDSGCTMRDAGTYRWSTSADGQWLTLDLIGDGCPVRAAFLPGTWQRNLAFRSQGGPGVGVNFEPFIALTLPAEPWTGTEFAEPDTLVLDNDPRTADLRIWKDVDGFVDACDIEPGRLDLAPGIDAFLDYLRREDRFTVVRQEELTVDGRRAVEVEIRLGDRIDQPCWPMDGNQADRRGVLLWAAHAAEDAVWNGAIGDQWSLVVTEVDGTTFVMEVVRQDGATWPVDRDILDSMRFVDAIPEPPAS